jgi:pimeloyl-ACP methyl ester carboxylesterase
VLGGAAAAAGVDTQDTGAAAEPVDLADAVRLHIEDSRVSSGGSGKGRAVVLIHGWPLSAKAWEPQVAVLRAAGYRVVAYDRRGFGRSDKPQAGYSYNVLADDLERVLDQCGLQDVTLVGFSMGGGEVARYISRWGESRLHSVVFAAAVPPFLLQSADNPDGPLSTDKAQATRAALEQDRSAFFDDFTKHFFSADGVLKVTDFQRAEATALCHQSDPQAALACMDAFGMTDFRDDLKKVAVPTLVIHGDADAVVPIEGSGLRTHRAIAHSQLVRIPGAPHGLNVSHATEFNAALLAFLKAPEWQ